MSAATVEQRLQEIEALRRKGLISDDEARAKRKQILDSF
jgi:hypothetical protein